MKDENMNKFVNESNEKYNLLYCDNLKLKEELGDANKIIGKQKEQQKSSE